MDSSNAPAATMYSFTFRRSRQTGIAHWTKARRWSSKSSRDQRDCRPRTWLWCRSSKQNSTTEEGPSADPLFLSDGLCSRGWQSVRNITFKLNTTGCNRGHPMYTIRNWATRDFHRADCRVLKRANGGISGSNQNSKPFRVSVSPVGIAGHGRIFVFCRGTRDLRSVG